MMPMMITRGEQRRRSANRGAEVVAAAFVTALALAGCKVDTLPTDAEPAGDAGQAADAASDAADASGACPGTLPYEVRARGWFGGEPLSGAELFEEGNAENAATTDAEGRALLCLPEAGGRARHRHPDAISWLAELAPRALRMARAAGEPFFAYPLSPGEADELFLQNLGHLRDPQQAQIVVDIRAYPEGEPLAGARAELLEPRFANVYAGAPGEAFVASDTLQGDDLLLFANVETSRLTTELFVTPPTGYQGRCAVPERVPLEAGSFTYVYVACGALE